MDVYSTLPLRTALREIRIAEFGPTSDEEAPITITRKVVDLADKPLYFALSRIWGEADNACSIVWNGFTISVTRNLHSASRRLRKAERKSIWVDQICINQSDIQERGNQVEFMYSIYQAAENVCVWLGEHRDGTALGLQTPRRLASYLDSGHGIEAQPEPAVNSDGPQIAAIEAYYHLYDSFWFQRCWVVQAVVSQAEPIAYIGDHEFKRNLLPLAQLGVSAGYLSNRDVSCSVDKIKVGESLMNNCGQAVNIMFNYGPRRTNQDLSDACVKYPLFAQLEEPLHVVDIFTSSVELLASDPRDKVHSFLRIASQLDNAIRPDYTLTIEETYLALSKCLIENGLGGELLTRAGSFQRCLAILPSWCLDLSDKPNKRKSFAVTAAESSTTAHADSS